MGRPRNLSREAAAAYRRRNRALRDLGFPNYAAYLLSPLWGRIRTAKLKEEDNRCFGCGKQRHDAQVHHSDYTRATLEGKRPEALYVVCEICHEKIEFFGGLKLGPKEATGRLTRLRGERKNGRF